MTDTASRRAFLKRSTAAVAGAGLAGGLTIARGAQAAGDESIKIALVGCGGRGTGAVRDALTNRTTPNLKLIAVADPFENQMENCLKRLRTQLADQVDVPRERMFGGFDGYKDAIACGADIIFLVTPPGFRPMQFEAAVEAGKHVFMEKPVAVDGPGVRRILAANETAKKKGLAVAVGLNGRHTSGYQEVARRVRDGILGRLLFLRAYGNNNGVWTRPRQPGQTEMEYQMRNWYYFNWLSGDLIVEQFIHRLDLCNWLAGGHPVEANGMGGRQVRVSPEHGEIFDHHAVEFTYGDGAKALTFCRHMPACWAASSGHAHGSKGYADVGRSGCAIHLDGQEPMTWEPGRDGHQVEHDHLFAALLAGEPYNEGDYGATSSLTAIMGRMATYSGKVVTWDEALNSELDLSPKEYTWDSEAPIRPDADGMYACAVPGVTKAW